MQNNIIFMIYRVNGWQGLIGWSLVYLLRFICDGIRCISISTQNVLFDSYLMMPASSNRRVWRQDEDQALIELIDAGGVQRWGIVAQKMNNCLGFGKRTGKQCRERWYNQLSPNLERGDWSMEEQQQIFQLHGRHGNRWIIIAQFLPGRTDNAIKNLFYSTIRKALRRICRILGVKNSTKEIRSVKPITLSKIFVNNINWRSEASGLEEQVERQRIKQKCNYVKQQIMKFSKITVQGQTPSHLSYPQSSVYDKEKYQYIFAALNELNHLFTEEQKKDKEKIAEKLHEKQLRTIKQQVQDGIYCGFNKKQLLKAFVEDMIKEQSDSEYVVQKKERRARQRVNNSLLSGCMSILQNKPQMVKAEGVEINGYNVINFPYDSVVRNDILVKVQHQEDYKENKQLENIEQNTTKKQQSNNSIIYYPFTQEPILHQNNPAYAHPLSRDLRLDSIGPEGSSYLSISNEGLIKGYVMNMLEEMGQKQVCQSRWHEISLDVLALLKKNTVNNKST